VRPEQELQHLRRRLKEAQETLQAIHRGAVDAVVVRGEQGEQVFYLDGADRFYRMTVERMQQGAVSLGRDGTIFYCNQRLAEMLGVPHQRILGQPMLPFVAPASRRCFEELLQNALSVNCQEELWLQAADGHQVPVFVAMNPLPLGEVAASSAIITDLTEHKRHEEAEAKAREMAESAEQLRLLNETLEQRVAERTAMAERRADQLRALAVELNQAEQRERRRLAQVLHDHLQQLLVAARLKLGLMQRRAHEQTTRQRIMQVDELLDQAISESRSLTVELSPPILYDAGLMAGLEWLSQYMREKHGLAVEVRAEESPDPLPEDVRLLAFQGTRELLFNVVKHAGTGCAQVGIAKNADHSLRVTVCDTGVGFDPKRLERGGSAEGGFGLFSIRERLELAGGDLAVKTGPGQGTCVTLTIPCDSPQRVVSSVKVAKVALAAAAPPSATTTTKIRVLLADDHEILRQGLAGLLEEEPDMEVIGQASDGQMAVELALRTKPDVIVMDVTMPRLNGVEATRRITAELPGVCVIGLSMHEQDEMAQAMREAGARAYLPKGDSSDSLITTIRTALETAARR
jgi:PAS domain S-box-containing protein